MYGYIYKITNLITNKIYIGKHKYYKYELDEKYITSGVLIKKSIKKYSIENFLIELVDRAETLEELNTKEQFYINKHDCKSPNGYNLTNGGDGAVGLAAWNKGLTKSTDVRVAQYTSNAQKTKIQRYNSAYGKQNIHLSEEHKLKIKNANKKQKPSELSKKRSSEVNSNTIWYTDGLIEKKFYSNDLIPEGFKKGRLKNCFPDHTGKPVSKETIEKIKISKSNTIWVNNGLTEKMIKNSVEIPEGFIRGRLKKNQ